MKALSLWQPWATYIANGAKRIETRHWPTGYRGPLAIHAASRWRPDQRESFHELQEFLQNRDLPQFLIEATPPALGCFVALARLADCYQMEVEDVDRQTDLEYRMGGWLEGRFAWVLEDVRPLTVTVPAKGHQGLWGVNPLLALELEKHAEEGR